MNLAGSQRKRSNFERFFLYTFPYLTVRIAESLRAGRYAQTSFVMTTNPKCQLYFVRLE